MIGLIRDMIRQARGLTPGGFVTKLYHEAPNRPLVRVLVSRHAEHGFVFQKVSAEFPVEIAEWHARQANCEPDTSRAARDALKAEIVKDKAIWAEPQTA